MDLVVIGLGYVGLPLVREACQAGLRVGGLDRDARVVAGLKAGLSHVDDVSDTEVEELLAGGFVPTRDEAILEGAPQGRWWCWSRRRTPGPPKKSSARSWRHPA